MPCLPIPGGFVCTRGGRRAAPCQEPGCTTPHVALCDWPLEGEKAGHTCDRRMCAAHRHKVGPNRDFCTPHYTAAREKQGTLL